MAIGYNWLCTACGAANVAGTSSCVACGCPAVTSAFEAESWARGNHRKPLNLLQRFILLFWGAAFVAGAVIEAATFPPDIAWFTGIALMIVCAVTGVVLGARWKLK
jgi:hypothetical protein